MDRVRGPRLAPTGNISERRGAARFPLSLDLRYVASGSFPVEKGFGRTIDLSSCGLSFTADRPLPPGLRLDIFIDWPAMLEGGVQLQLAVLGEIVRNDGLLAALKIERHEFRTRRAG